jgi:prepilin-type N-terminal cleavage/methylation domain-containing protein
MRRESATASGNPLGQAGFTLVEMAISLCIIGLLMTGGMAGIARYFEVQRNHETHRKIEFVMNALGGYVQAHYRLPCPADPNASAAQAGREGQGGSCAAVHGELAGIVPWKELAIPQNMVVDGWGRYITYKPASRLTIDTLAPAMTAAVSSADVPAACRTANWYDADGNHLNRAKALFCCNAEPQENETVPALLAGAGDMDAEAAAAIEPAAGGDMPEKPAPVPKGSFSNAHYMSGPASPLLKSTDMAVTLTGGSSGDAKGSVALSLRSDQLFARVGSGSCQTPPPAVSAPYACVPQSFHSDNGVQTVTDATGAAVPIPTLYGVSVALAGKNYQLRAALTKASDLSRDDSLGFYVVRSDGTISGVRMLLPNVRQWLKGETEDFSISLGDDAIGIGLFVIPDGYKKMDKYKDIDLSHLKFVTNYAQFNERTASVADQTPPVLVSYGRAGIEIALTGHDVTAYHLYGNLNPGRAGHILSRQGICHIAGEKVGVNGDITCLQPSPVADAGIDAAHPAFAQIAFEESPGINCYETKAGGCRQGGALQPEDVLSDGNGGYAASIGENKYADLAFSIGLASCPQTQ